MKKSNDRAIKTESYTLCSLRDSFTLVEMLVVIAIISILSSMLLPSINNSIQAARSIECANKLKQIGVSVHMYVNDQSGWLPATEAGGYCNWVSLIAQQTDGISKWNYGWSSASESNTKQLFQCSSGGDQLEYGINLMYHRRAGCYIAGLASTNPQFKADKLSKVKKPSIAVLIIDGKNKDKTPSSSFSLSWEAAQHVITGHYIDWRHKDSCNMLFLDNHVKQEYSNLALPDEAVTWAF